MKSHKYNSEVTNIAITGLMIAITVLFSFLTSAYSFIPKIPLLGGRPDPWFGIMFISLIFIEKKYIALYIFALPFALMPTELSDSYAGLGDYFLSLALPMIICLLAIIKPKKVGHQILWFTFIFILYFIVRFLLMSLSGVIFWNTPIIPSMSYNFFNVASDFVISGPIFLLGFLKLSFWRKK